MTQAYTSTAIIGAVSSASFCARPWRRIIVGHRRSKSAIRHTPVEAANQKITTEESEERWRRMV